MFNSNAQLLTQATGKNLGICVNIQEKQKR